MTDRSTVIFSSLRWIMIFTASVFYRTAINILFLALPFDSYIRHFNFLTVSRERKLPEMS